MNARPQARNWIYDRFYLQPEMDRLEAESVAFHIDYLKQTMEKCRKHLWPEKPMEYDIQFDKMLDLWATCQEELIAWSSK